jgi:hypothetical protein
MGRKPDAEFVSRVAALARESGLDFQRAPLVQEMMTRGWSRSGAYREVARCLTTGEVRQALHSYAAIPPSDEATLHALAARELSAETEKTMKATQLPAPDGSVGYTLGELVTLFQRSVQVIEKVMAHAHDGEGKVRMARLALLASAQLRDATIGYTKLLAAAHNAQSMQAFINEVVAVLEDVGRNHAAAGVEIALRLQVLSAKWRV